MKIDLKNKTALVTGSTQGIGYAIAKGFAQAGANVVLNGRNKERVEQAASKLENEVPGTKIKAIAADVSTEEGANKLLKELPEVDILINNLGIFESRPALEITDEEWSNFFQVNVLSAIRLTRAYIPKMQEKSWGRVLFIASDSAIVIPEEMIHYGVSKTALLGVSRGFAKAAKGTGVTVNSIIVGPTFTDGVKDFVYQLVDKNLPWEKAEKEFMKTYRPQSLLQRLIQPEEVANMCVYISSPLASATTGGALRVDGGYVDSILP